MNRKLLFFTLIALLISIILEITLFNYTHYGTLFTSKHFSFEYGNQRIISNAPEYSLNGIFPQDSLLFPAESISGLEFYNLNTEVASIYINPVFIQGDRQRVRVIWADEYLSRQSIDVSIIKDLDFSNYITITPRGKVSDLVIVFLENNIAIKQVELNKEIPRAIMPIRLVIVFGISLLLLCLKNAKHREKISYFCFDYLYDKTNVRQRIGFATLICFMLVFNFLISYSICGFRDNEFLPRWLKLYSHNMTDALLKRQLHLDIKVPQALLEAKKPYDDEYRRQHGMFLNFDKNLDDYENSLLIDAAFYNGKYYSYYGMLPVIVLFAPYKLITGNYLPNSMAAFLFASVATIFLMLLWKQIAQNYLKKCSYFFFLICSTTLYIGSLIPIHMTQVSGFHRMVQYSALTFVIFGVIMLLRARENVAINSTPTKYLIISSFSFALAVACRPSYLLWSILIPVALWDKRKELINTSRYLLAIIIPFAIVGSVLAWYNYARFDSPFTFGQTYLIMLTNQSMYNQIGIIGQIHSTIKTFLFMLFNPPNLGLTFPFVIRVSDIIPSATTNNFMSYDSVIGIFCFPIMWFLFYVRKVSILRNFIFAGIFISLLNIILFVFVGLNWNYVMDFSWFVAIGALICAFQLQEKEFAMRKIILKAFYSCCGITLLFGFFITISYRIYSPPTAAFILDTKIYHYLARTFGVICNVP